MLRGDTVDRDIMDLLKRKILASNAPGGIMLSALAWLPAVPTGFAALPPAWCFVAHRRTGTPGTRRLAPFMPDRTSVR